MAARRQPVKGDSRHFDWKDKLGSFPNLYTCGAPACFLRTMVAMTPLVLTIQSSTLWHDPVHLQPINKLVRCFLERTTMWANRTRTTVLAAVSGLVFTSAPISARNVYQYTNPWLVPCGRRCRLQHCLSVNHSGV